MQHTQTDCADPSRIRHSIFLRHAHARLAPYFLTTRIVKERTLKTSVLSY